MRSKKVWKMAMNVIPIVVGAVGTIPKWTGRIEIMQTTVSLRSSRILGGVLETCCHSDSYERQLANTSVKKLPRSILLLLRLIIIIIIMEVPVV